MSAHSKVDTSTGELFVFSTDMEKPKAFCSVFDADRNLKNSYEVPLSSVRIIHEFLITEKYAIIPDLPLELDIMNAMFNKKYMINLNKKAKCRYGIIPRYSNDSSNIKWFDIDDACYTFHFGNAWETTNEQGHEIVTVYSVTMTDVDLDF